MFSNLNKLGAQCISAWEMALLGAQCISAWEMALLYSSIPAHVHIATILHCILTICYPKFQMSEHMPNVCTIMVTHALCSLIPRLPIRPSRQLIVQIFPPKLTSVSALQANSLDF